MVMKILLLVAVILLFFQNSQLRDQTLDMTIALHLRIAELEQRIHYRNALPPPAYRPHWPTPLDAPLLRPAVLNRPVLAPTGQEALYFTRR